MLKAFLGRVARLGISPRVLMAHVAVLRAIGRLPKLRTEPPNTINQIFFSFPYYAVGDLVLSLTLIDRVHDRWPEAKIDVAVGSQMGSLVAAIPYVRRVFRLSPPEIQQPTIAAYAQIHKAIRLFHRQIAHIAYDLTIAPRWDSFDSYFSAHLAYLTGAPIRCGYSGSSDGGSTEVDRFYTVAAVGGADEHESLRYMRLLSRCGFEPFDAVDERAPQRPILVLQQIAEERKCSGEAMKSPLPGRYVVFSPGANNPRRIWPISRFGEIGRALYDRYELKTILVGGPADVTLCSELNSLIGESAVSMAGKTDPRQMLDLIAGAELFLGNDSGPAHIAGGVGISTVVISPFSRSCISDHINSPRRFRPAGPYVQVLQPISPMTPCWPTCDQNAQHCILQVSCAEVLASLHAEIHQRQSVRA